MRWVGLGCRPRDWILLSLYERLLNTLRSSLLPRLVLMPCQASRGSDQNIKLTNTLSLLSPTNFFERGFPHSINKFKQGFNRTTTINIRRSFENYGWLNCGKTKVL
ncbi:hypothetical protein L1987_02341 [Smallanthus sonchifolius]|uniref:Uncharacterized protein n=1 Tax=Smallanthus sonchifolius TaxID=185202 RepID=A0ACB9K7Q0_9ASTR|nr:hypothetical protein L1987_02341 [Smallanthus sonchifolius]